MYTFTHYQYADLQDYLLIFYSGLYLVVITRMLSTLNVSWIDISIICVGNVIFYKRYLLIISLNNLCRELEEPLTKLLDVVKERQCSREDEK